jgi:DNA-directed RNA polymerase subunit F
VSKDHLETKILYKLVCYPNFKNIHAEQIVNVTRVCALLSIESKTAQEIKRFLNLSIDEIQKIIEIIKKEAYPNYETIHENIVSILPFSTEAISTVPQRIEQNSLFYFLIKFWKRLKGEL